MPNKNTYKGTIPTPTIKKGTKGQNVKNLQTFLNWYGGYKLAVDGIDGVKTTNAVKSFQKAEKLTVDGIYGNKSYNAAKAYKYVSWQDNANSWATAIANDNSWHYVKFTNNKKTHECPICHHHAKGKYHGWNCIGFAFSVWHHGGVLGNTCNCHVITNGQAEKMLSAKTTSDAYSIAKKCTGLSGLQIIRNKNGIPKNQWQNGDICLKFNGSTFSHMFYYMGNGKIVDSHYADGKIKNNDQIKVRSYDSYKCKIIIRYTGK